MSLNRAKAWAAAGWPVFPVVDGRPVADWREQATIIPREIEGYWAQYPNATVACVPGLAGCWVLDVDVKGGKQGDKSLADLSVEHAFEGWEYPQQRTPSGGRHLFFRGAGTTSVETLGPGLDTRGGTAEGGLGFIFCHVDRPPAKSTNCPAPPASLAAKLGEPRKRQVSVEAAPAGGWDLPENVRRATKYLAALPPPGEGERNATLFKHACAVRDLGVAQSTLLDLLNENPAALGDPPLDDDEIETTVDSAYRNGQLDAGNRASSGALERLAAEVWAERPTGRRKLALWSERRNRPAPPWLWHEILPAGGLVGLYGQGGSYKTFLALRLAVAISSGEPHLGQHTLRHGPVVYIAGEGQQEPRLRALEALYGPIPDRLALFDGLDLSSAEDQALLRDDLQLAITETWGGQAPVAIFVDTLNRAAPGMDENSARDMSEIVATCDNMRRALGCAVVLVHHTPKGSDDWRGSTAVWNALDAAILMKNKGKGRGQMTLRRSKDAEDGKTWDVVLSEQGKTLAVTGVTWRKPADISAGGDNGHGKLAQQQRLRELAVVETRAKVAKDILGAANSAVSPRALSRQMCATLEGADGESVRSWLRAVVKKGGGLNEAHPLASCVATIAPLSFTAASSPPR